MDIQWREIDGLAGAGGWRTHAMASSAAGPVANTATLSFLPVPAQGRGLNLASWMTNCYVDMAITGEGHNRGFTVGKYCETAHGLISLARVYIQMKCNIHTATTTSSHK